MNECRSCPSDRSLLKRIPGRGTSAVFAVGINDWRWESDTIYLRGHIDPAANKHLEKHVLIGIPDTKVASDMHWRL